MTGIKMNIEIRRALTVLYIFVLQSCTVFDDETCTGVYTKDELSIIVSNDLIDIDIEGSYRNIYENTFVEGILIAYTILNDGTGLDVFPANLLSMSFDNLKEDNLNFNSLILKYDGEVIYEYIFTEEGHQYETREVVVKFNKLPECNFEKVHSRLSEFDITGLLVINNLGLQLFTLIVEADNFNLHPEPADEIVTADISYTTPQSTWGSSHPWEDAPGPLTPTTGSINFSWDRTGAPELGIPQVWDMQQFLKDDCGAVLPGTCTTCNCAFPAGHSEAIGAVLDKGFRTRSAEDHRREWTGNAEEQLPDALWTHKEWGILSDVSGAGPGDWDWHGTQVASVMSSRLGDGRGTAGTAALGTGGLVLYRAHSRNVHTHDATASA